MSKLTKDQYRDLSSYLGKPMLQDIVDFLLPYETGKTSYQLMAEVLDVMLSEPELTTSLPSDLYIVPSISTTPINRLRVLADEIQKVASELYANSLPRNQDVFDDARDIRESIGKMIAFAALNTPMRTEHK